MNETTKRVLERELARHEKWLAGDWNSRTARGCDAASRHRRAVHDLRIALAEKVA